MTKYIASVITRTYADRAAYLQRAAECVFSQTIGPIEWIIVEDGLGTAQSTLALLPPPAHVDIQYLRNTQGGRSKSANMGLEAVQGEFISFFDDDDEIFENHIFLLSQLLRKYTTAAGSYAASFKAKRCQDGNYNESDQIVSLDISGSSAALLKHNMFPIQSVMFRKSILGITRFDEKIDALEDWLFWADLFFGSKLVWSPSITSRFYIYANRVEEEARLKPHYATHSYVSTKIDNIWTERSIIDKKKMVQEMRSCHENALVMARLEGFVL